MNDLRFAIRMLSKSPGFTAVVVLTLGLCLGVNTSIFSAVNAFLFHSLPYPEQDRLVRIFRASPHSERAPHSVADYLDYQRQNRVFEELAAFQWSDLNLGGDGELPERLLAFRVSANFFSLLGVAPELGRVFLAEEDQPGQENVVVLSHGLWLRRFGGDTNILGQTVRLNSEPVTVVGVMPARFDCPQLWQFVEAWKPIAFTADQKRNRGWHNLNLLGRLKAGVSRARAETELNTLADRLAQQYPDTNAGETVAVMQIRESFHSKFDPLICYFLLAAVGFVLLIGCVNVANLHLARMITRRREMAIRTALGAGRGRLLSQLLIEGLVLAVLGGGLGVLIAFWTNEALLAAINPHLIGQGLAARSFAINLPVLVYASGLVVVTGIVIGILPAVQTDRSGLTHALREGGSLAFSTGRSWLRLRSWLVITQVAVTLTLLAGCGLFGRALAGYLGMDPGFRTEKLLAFRVSLPSKKYPDRNHRTDFYLGAMERLGALPGVERVGAGTSLPIWDLGSSRTFQIEGQPQPEPGQSPLAQNAVVSPEYFQMLGIPLKEGRLFTDQDREAVPRVVVVNEAMARKFWPGARAVGKRIFLGTAESGDWREIVGVVQDTRHPASSDWMRTKPEFYESMWQEPGAWAWLILRTAQQPEALANTLRQTMATLDPDIPAYRITTVKRALASAFIAFRVMVWLLAGFSFVGLLLAALGLYGVISYSIARRSHEIGIRVALGARRQDVLGLVLRQGMVLVSVGLAFGLGGAGALSYSIRRILFGMSPADPGTFAVIIVVLSVTGMLACYLPARRATKVEPMIALRCE